MVPPAILCNLTVAGLPLSVAAEASFTGSVFDPAIPISLGMTQDNLGNSVGLMAWERGNPVYLLCTTPSHYLYNLQVEGFEGCISDLAMNGDMTGFQ